MTPANQSTPEVTRALKPCPFCGSEPQLMGFNAPEFWVSCLKIGCKAGTEAFGSKDRAIDAWNTRTPARGGDELREALERNATWFRFDPGTGEYANEYCTVKPADAAGFVAMVPVAAALASTDMAGAGEGISYAERLAYEERILAAQMQLVAARRALTPFATKACGWEQNHPGYHGTGSTQISHRLGDFRDARAALTSIDAYFAGEEA